METLYDAAMSVQSVSNNARNAHMGAISPPLSEESTTRVPLPTRRNGKPQSCEPCRLSKVSCDHHRPRCGRCTKKGIEPQCVYHPAPLTRPNNTRQRVSKRHESAMFTPYTSSSLSSNPLEAITRHHSNNDNENSPIELESTGDYLGPTNYTAVLRETQPHFGAELWPRTSSDTDFYPEKVKSSVAHTGCDLRALDVAVDILSSFPPEALTEKLLFGLSDTCFSLPLEVLRRSLKQFWTKWRSAMIAKNFDVVAKALLAVQSKPMRIVQRTDQWMKCFTVDESGFVIIGTFFALFGLEAWSYPPWDPIFDTKKYGLLAKKEFTGVLGESADACLDLCNCASSASEPLIWLMHYVQVCQSLYRGDDDAFQWQKLGLVSTAVTSFGLHRSISYTNVPFVVAETRKRTFAYIYVTDKHLATYTGRPPRLSQRFCAVKLPLELTDDELMADEKDLPAILAKLDSNGWTTDGKWRKTSFIRLLVIMAKICDEVLELCLGPSDEVTLARKQSLKVKNDDAYNSVPVQFRWDEDDAAVLLVNGDLLTARLIFRLEYYMNIFQLERLPHDGSETDQERLLSVSLSMLGCISYYVNHRPKLEFYNSLAWELVYYAIPPASVLLLELIKQHQYPRIYKQVLPRSEIIQSLSIYISFLGSVGPEEGNYRVCQQMKRVVKRVLDEVLEQPSYSAPQIEQAGSGRTDQSMPEMDMSAVLDPSDDPSFTKWLQSIDWTNAPWTDSPGFQ